MSGREFPQALPARDRRNQPLIDLNGSKNTNQSF